MTKILLNVETVKLELFYSLVKKHDCLVHHVGPLCNLYSIVLLEYKYTSSLFYIGVQIH